MDALCAGINFMINVTMPKNNYSDEQLADPIREILPIEGLTIDSSSPNYLLPFYALNTINNKIFNSFIAIENLINRIESTEQTHTQSQTQSQSVIRQKQKTLHHNHRSILGFMTAKFIPGYILIENPLTNTFIALFAPDLEKERCAKLKYSTELYNSAFQQIDKYKLVLSDANDFELELHDIISKINV